MKSVKRPNLGRVYLGLGQNWWRLTFPHSINPNSGMYLEAAKINLIFLKTKEHIPLF